MCRQMLQQCLRVLAVGVAVALTVTSVKPTYLPGGKENLPHAEYYDHPQEFPEHIKRYAWFMEATKDPGVRDMFGYQFLPESSGSRVFFWKRTTPPRLQDLGLPEYVACVRGTYSASCFLSDLLILCGSNYVQRYEEVKDTLVRFLESEVGPDQRCALVGYSLGGFCSTKFYHEWKTGVLSQFTDRLCASYNFSPFFSNGYATLHNALLKRMVSTPGQNFVLVKQEFPSKALQTIWRELSDSTETPSETFYVLNQPVPMTVAVHGKKTQNHSTKNFIDRDWYSKLGYFCTPLRELYKRSF